MSRVHAHPAPIPTPPRRPLVPRLRPRHRVRPSVEFGRHDHHVFHTHTVPRTAAKPAPPTTGAPRRRHRSLRARRRPPAARVSVRPSGPDGSGHAGGIAHAWQPSIRCFAPWLHRGRGEGAARRRLRGLPCHPKAVDTATRQTRVSICGVACRHSVLSDRRVGSLLDQARDSGRVGNGNGVGRLDLDRVRVRPLGHELRAAAGMFLS